MYTHKYLRPHHSWFILLSNNNNNIIRRIMLLAHRLSSCKFHSCTKIPRHVCTEHAAQNNCPKNACVEFVPLHLSVRVYLWHVWLVYMHGPALYFFHNGVLLIYIFFIGVINSGFLTSFESKNCFVFCTKKLTRSEMVIIIL